MGSAGQFSITPLFLATVDPISAGSIWTTCPPHTKSKCTVPGLTAGTKYWFRVAAVGVAGQGPWSDPALRMAQ